ncbi:MAG: hypothetical protein JSS12_06640 [Verrucomicrobia bacterium]|nr:hypothetical protein [Verrucomicrobiota bacterium]
MQRNSKLLRKEGFCLAGTGGNSYPTIRYISETYWTSEYQYTSIDDARKLFCRIYEMYEVPFNSDKRIRPYLHNFPLTDENIQISITFFDKDRNDLVLPYIESVYTNKGELIFESRDEHGKFVILHKEPFQHTYSLYKKSKGAK